MNTIILKFVESEIIESPHFEKHKRGRNWACKIAGKNSIEFTRSPLKMLGIKVSTTGVEIGDALEFGGDYITSSGNTSPERGYYLVKNILEEGIVVEVYVTLAKLIKAKNLK